jgi:AAA+ ATPase superfamily predicted ATPase
MAYNFLDREAELGCLQRAWDAPGAQLILMWGRRRTGKTRLLGEWVAGKRAVYYGATEQAVDAELRGLSRATREALPPRGTDLLAHGDFADWEQALGYLARLAERRRLAVVLDEWPYLVESEPGLPSILQRFWDQRDRGSKLRLVLCGSAQSVMEELQHEQAPLFRRVDVRLQLRPFGYRDAARFVPRLAPAERAVCYAVLGGMPTYLSRWDDARGHRANLRRLFGDPSSPLIEEGEFVLSSELPEGAGYFRILRAIAAGSRTYGKIRDHARIDIARQLERLLAIGLVERVVPVTEDPARTKRACYRIADNFLAFWFRFVYPRRADVARGLGREVVDRAILPALPDYLGEPWEEMCRDFLRARAARGELPVEVSSIGRWWNADSSVEIDAVGVQGSRVVLAASAKWSATAGRGELARLARAAEQLPNRAPEVTLALFARDAVQGVLPDEALAFTSATLYSSDGSQRRTKISRSP